MTIRLSFIGLPDVCSRFSIHIHFLCRVSPDTNAGGMRCAGFEILRNMVADLQSAATHSPQFS